VRIPQSLLALGKELTYILMLAREQKKHCSLEQGELKLKKEKGEKQDQDRSSGLGQPAKAFVGPRSFELGSR